MDKSIVYVIEDKINALDFLISNAQDKDKIYYKYMKMNLLKLLRCYGVNRSISNFNDDLEMNLFLHEKDDRIIHTLFSSRDILYKITDVIVDYLNSNPVYPISAQNYCKIDNNKIIEGMIKNNGLQDIYEEYKYSEIIDFNKTDIKEIRGYSSFYNLLDLKGNHLIYINEYYDDVKGLTKYAHEYGHFLSDYYLNFDIKKITQKNIAYNEIISEIMYYKMRDYLNKCNIIDNKIFTHECNSFTVDSIVLYIFSHYDIDYNDQELLEVIKEDIKYKYPKMNINITYLSNDRVIYAFMYLIAQYIGKIYAEEEKPVIEAKNALFMDINNLEELFKIINIDINNLYDKKTIENNLEKILIKK
ncbi:MAG TPA: hypothetical protein PLV83_03975 [Bacilli bacterium]|nr:hypothetical protein [Bacilli bacterium]